MNVSEESGSFSVGINKIGSNERPVSVRIFTVSASAIGQSYSTFIMSKCIYHCMGTVTIMLDVH